MQFNPQGTVTEVTVVTAEGVGLKLRSRAIAAGYLSLFFPDKRRARAPLLWRRELSFEPE
ncbi:hypothetical protein DXO170_05315 [Xanthomonas oryzae pv. oryzae]|nr:hypothetical protein [Xanthomonas oryzae]ACD59141.1 hypothetical protein PXO_01022 [Xanthomonas oryzae pv. oryzae PXO99A]AJQ83127.1 hypothetical protein AZ54_11335 [Xanthomonas oryzae pv. oryzae PXO86]ACD59332.1 hypothetical protein PXO_06144 [Xanthomonas oryzae pv. oryzae PXO99A]OLG38607.1 hypothetical protein BXO6_00910 [Xanthomonas oryzae pv. oryzae]OLG39195.1 hypothetical protein BXO2_02495 [Xanthomonas oryzae pv. oryzae]